MNQDLFVQPTQAQPKVLRDHQVKALTMLRDSMRRGNRRIVVSLPTGAGKTVIAAEIIRMAQEKGNKAVFTAPAVSLINQTVERFEEQGVTDIGVMQANHKRTNPDASVQVATVQTLQRRDIPEASLVIVDECHIRQEVVSRMLRERQGLYFVGLSATPWAEGMAHEWDDMVVPVTIGNLIDKGFLSKFSAYAPDKPDLSHVRTVAGEYSQPQLQEVMGAAPIVGNVVQTWLDKGEGRPTLCFCINRNHAAQLTAEFNNWGIACAYVDGNTDTVAREAINERFKGGEYQIICSVRTMTTGVDLPVSCIIDAAPTQSEMLHVQKIGRGLRVNPGTEDCLILDHAGNSLRLGLVTDIGHDELDCTEPGKKKKAKPKSEKLPKECTKCGALKTTALCPHCGHESKPPPIEAAKGELRQIGGKVKKPSFDEKEFWYRALLWIAESRGYNPGWAYHKYRERFGFAPSNRFRSSPEYPSKDVFNWIKSRQIAYAKTRDKGGAA